MDAFLAEYKEPDINDIGTRDTSSYLVVNVAGFYRHEHQEELDNMNIVRTSGRLDYTYCYVAAGKVNLSLEHEDYVVENGFFLIPPGMPHRYNNHDTTVPFEIYWVHFSGSISEDYLKECGLDRKRVFYTGAIEEIKNIIPSIARELSLRTTGYENMMQALLMQALALSSRYAAFAEQKAKGKGLDMRMQKALEYIFLWYKKDITVEELAGVTKLSVSRFSAVFKETFGLYPMQYVTNFRLKKACGLLRHTEYSVAEIADLVGFSDPLYFSRVFKRHMSVSPSQYRKAINPEVFHKLWDQYYR